MSLAQFAIQSLERARLPAAVTGPRRRPSI